MKAGVVARLALLVLVLTPALALAPRPARAQSPSVELISDDACERARAFEADDQSEAAQSARRGCRLERFGVRLAAERQQQLAAEEQSRAAWLEAYTEATQPARISHPVAVAGFLGSGLASYGLAVTWSVVQHLELEGWYGQRGVSMSDSLSSHGSASYTRQVLGMGGRWIFSDKDLSPFVGGGFAVAGADMQLASTVFSQPNRGVILPPDMSGSANPSASSGSARANMLNGSAGLALAVKNLRIMLAYVYTYTFYSGANDSDMQKTPDDNLRQIWLDGLNHDRHAIRFQVGYAF
jgi:hypothetical protein